MISRYVLLNLFISRALNFYKLIDNESFSFFFKEFSYEDYNVIKLLYWILEIQREI